MGLMDIRRRVIINGKHVQPVVEIVSVSANNITSSTLSLTNSHGTTIDSTNYDGEIIVSQSSAVNPSSPTDYENGMFAVSFDKTLPQGQYYRMVADVTITNSILGSNILRITSAGDAAYASDAVIENGKINQVFYHKVQANRNYIALRVCGNSLIIRNIKIFPANAPA